MKSNGHAKVAGLVGSGAVSCGAALVLLFKLVTPQAIGGLGTPELLGVLSLLVMPVAALWALKRATPQSLPEATPKPQTPAAISSREPVSRQPAAAPLRKAA